MSPIEDKVIDETRNSAIVQALTGTAPGDVILSGLSLGLIIGLGWPTFAERLLDWLATHQDPTMPAALDEYARARRRLEDLLGRSLP